MPLPVIYFFPLREVSGFVGAGALSSGFIAGTGEIMSDFFPAGMVSGSFAGASGFTGAGGTTSVSVFLQGVPILLALRYSIGFFPVVQAYPFQPLVQALATSGSFPADLRA